MKKPTFLALALLPLACAFAVEGPLPGLPAVRAATATWAPQTILAADFTFSESDSSSKVAVSLAGRAVSTWDKPLTSPPIGFGGPKEVHASVYNATAGTWSAPARLSPAEVSAANAGAAVDPSTGRVTVAWSAAGLPSVSTSDDGGATWVASAVPVAAGYTFLTGSALIDTDAKGNVTFILVKPRPAGDGYDVAAVTRSSSGAWRAPVALNGAAGVAVAALPSLEVISDGRALLSMGNVTFRRASSGAWAAARMVNTTGFDRIDRASTDMDANGRGYMLLRLMQGGTAGLYLSTSSQTGDWSLPRRLTAIDTFYNGLQVTASASGRAMISASDSLSHVRATVTTDGGSTWTAPGDFGVGLVPQADGSESGLYALTWFSTGNSAVVASGSGVGTAPWTQSTIGNYALSDTPAVAIAGKSGSTSARAAAVWERAGDPAAAGGGVAVSAATVRR